MSEWLDLMLGEIDRQREEQREAEEEARRREADKQAAQEK